MNLDYIKEILAPGWNFVIEDQFGELNVANKMSIVDGRVDFLDADGGGGQGHNPRTMKIHLVHCVIVQPPNQPVCPKCGA
jgi:hypothetical protein